MNHFKERRPRWAILDEERGTLVGMAFPLNLGATDAALYRTKREAVEAKNLHCPGCRVVKVEVQYERCL